MRAKLKQLIFILTLSITSLSHAQEIKRYFYDNGTIEQEGAYNADGNAIGEWKIYNENGVLTEVGNYNNDKRTGKWKFYDKTGFLTKVGDYSDGKKTGEWKLYEKDDFLEFNGYLKAVGNYDNNQKIGEWKIYGDINITSIRNFNTNTLAMYRRGILTSKGNLEDNGKATGEWKEYYKDGSISGEGLYSNGLQIGVWKEYHENGKLKSIGSHNGVGDFFWTSRKCEWKTYHDNGQLESIENYTENDGNPTGKWSFYHKNGTLGKEKDFLNGKLQSEVTIDENSGIKEEIIYYPSEEIKTKIQYRSPDDLLNVFVCKGPKGEDLDYGSLKDGNGTYKEYDIAGKLANTYTVKDGKVITKENEENQKDKELEKEKPKVYDSLPIFPGCEFSRSNEESLRCFSKKIQRFVRKNFDMNIFNEIGFPSGKTRTFTRFTINKKGQVTNILSRADHPRIEEEIRRVFNLMPKMLPAKNDGESVDIPYDFPLMFYVE